MRRRSHRTVSAGRIEGSYGFKAFKKWAESDERIRQLEVEVVGGKRGFREEGHVARTCRCYKWLGDIPSRGAVIFLMLGFGNSYLELAEHVLLSTRRPMAAKEMLDEAFLRKIVPPHLHGKTQHKTLHARLSEDIARHLENSRFFRTAPGRFYLSCLKSDPRTPSGYKDRYLAPPRRKELRREKILSMYIPAPSAETTLSERWSIAEIASYLEGGNSKYLFWRDIKKLPDYAPIYSFVIVHRDEEILSFRSGKFTADSDPLQGARSIGFGGAVLASDADLLYESFFGIISNGINELVYGLGLPRRLAEDARYLNSVRPHFGALLKSPKTQLHYLHVILSYRCPDDFMPTNRALSRSDLRWVRAGHGVNNTDQYDETSKYIFDQGLLGDIVST